MQLLHTHLFTPLHGRPTWFRQEELANTITHSIAFCAALFGLYFLLVRAETLGNERTVIACFIYGVSVMATYFISATYHFTMHPRIKHFFHILDHMVIFLMIAGTYTPFTLITLAGPWGWSLFAIVWSIAIFGILFKILFTGRFNVLSTILYLIMGWIALIAIVPIVESLPTIGLVWLIGGGILYTIGIFFYLMESVPFAHTIWHLFVIAGSIAHFVCIYNYVAIRPV